MMKHACGFIHAMAGRAMVLLALAVLPGSIPATAASPAAGYPKGTITFIVGATAGGATDIVARVVGQQLSKVWGVPVVVTNRPGAGGEIADIFVAGSKPDGQTVLVAASAFGVLAGLSTKLPYDVLTDFAGIGLMARTPSFLVVPPGRGIRTLQQLRSYGKASPSGMVYGSAGIGSTGQLHAAIVAHWAGFQSRHAPYRGTPEAVNDVIAKRLDYAFSPGPNSLPFLKSGKLDIIATTSAAGQKFVPGVRTLEQAGVSGDPGDDWYAAFVPARTPMAIRVKLSDEISRILKMPSVRTAFAAVGGEPAYNTPTELDAMLKQYVNHVHQIGQQYDIRVQ